MTEPIPEITRRQMLEQTIGFAAGTTLGLAGSAWAATGARPSGLRSRIKIAQIGTGHPHAKGKIKTLRRLSNIFELVGIAEPDVQLRKEAQTKEVYRGLKWMSIEQLLATKGLEAVTIETSEDQLVPTAMPCIEAGLHIHLDKAPGRSLVEFEKLLRAAKAKGLQVQAGYMFRYNPGFKFCFEAVKKGWLGKVFEVHGVISKTISDSRRRKMTNYAGGSMFLLGCHLIDALVAVLGAPEKVTPYIRRTRPNHDNLADNMLAVFEYPTATATIRSSLVEVEGGQRRQFVICGDKGTVEIRPLEPPKVRLALAEPKGRYRKGYQDVSLPPMPERYDEQLMDFALLVRGRKQPDYSIEHDLAVHKALLEASGLAVS